MSDAENKVEFIPLSLEALLNNVETAPIKTFVYGGAGSGKSTNLISMTVPYLMSGYSILYVITETNALSGLNSGLAVYYDKIKDYLRPGKFFVANLVNQINDMNKDAVASVKSPEKSATTRGGAHCSFEFFTDKPLCYDITDSKKTKVKFMGLNNLTVITPQHKALIILDGYTVINADVGGWVRWSQPGVKQQETAMNRAGLVGSGTNVAYGLFAALNTDLVAIGHERVASLDATLLMGKDSNNLGEVKERQEVLSEMNDGAKGMPALGTNTTRAVFLSSFNNVLHAEDLKKPNEKMPRFIFTDIEDSTWYSRVMYSLQNQVLAYRRVNKLPSSILPQDFINSAFIGFLEKEGRLSDYERVLDTFNLKSLF